MEKKTHFVRDFLQNSIGNSSTSTTCNPIYIAGTILQLQITMEFCRPHMHEKHLKPHLQCGTDPTMIRAWSEHDPTTHETVSQPSHRRGRSSRFGDGLCMEKHRLSCICYLSKTHFVRDFLQNSIGNSSTSTTCNPIYSEGTILELQITMEFHRQLIHQHHLQPHLQCGNDPTVANHNGILSTAHARKTVETPFTMRNRPDHGPRMIRAWSENDPRMIRPHTRPSRNRRTADVDHRGSGTDFVWKNIGFRASAISQKRISCETSFKTPSATPPPAPLQSHLHCGNDPRVANHNGILSTAHARKTLETPFTMRNRSDHDPNMIRAWSEHDPTTHETVSQPSHRRGRSSRFGDGLCMEKHRLSCICYLSKTHFVRDFLQNSIGNSSTSTTCNPIYSEGTILELQITMEFHWQLIHQHHLQPHLQCGNDPTVANHNGILSTAHARKTVETPFTMRNRPDHGPRMIRAWSENDPRMIRPHTRPSRNRRTADVDHRGSGTDFVWKNIGFRASAISQKRISCETSFKTPSATPPPAPLAIPFTLRERSYSCKSQWNSVDRACTKNTWNPIYNAESIRPWSEHDPSMIRPHTRPSRNRRTAEVDHRGSGTDFVWKNIGFRASAISQKRISCETSFKTPSATPPPAPLAIPFTVREQFLWLTRSLTNSFFANSFFALSLTNSFFANSFFDYLTYPD